jgi:hypothetical protein
MNRRLYRALQPTIDAGGRRQRSEDAARANAARNERVLAHLEAAAGRRRKLAAAAGKIPVLTRLKEVRELDFNAEQVFPAVQVARHIPLEGILEVLSGSSQQVPIKAVHSDEGAVGPHFDAYYEGYNPWTLHVNLEGSSRLRACFLTKQSFTQYVQLAEKIDGSTEPGQELLAAQRAAFGNYDMTRSKAVLEGDIEPGTRTLLWHGLEPKFRLKAGGFSNRELVVESTPAVHDFLRPEIGSYEIYDVPREPLTVLPVGFEAAK